MTPDESNYGVTWLDLSPANVTIISQAREVGISVPHIRAANPVSFGGTACDEYTCGICRNVIVFCNSLVFAMKKSLQPVERAEGELLSAR